MSFEIQSSGWGHSFRRQDMKTGLEREICSLECLQTLHEYAEMWNTQEEKFVFQSSQLRYNAVDKKYCFVFFLNNTFENLARCGSCTVYNRQQFRATEFGRRKVGGGGNRPWDFVGRGRVRAREEIEL